MKPETLATICPVLYHMAEQGAWPSIRTHGLLSTEALLDLFEVHGSRRERILGSRRTCSETICHTKHRPAVIRDQKPMDDKGLRRCLPKGVTPEDWYRLLNSKVFFWATLDRLETLLKAYSESRHTILVIDTAALVRRYGDKIAVTTMNTGATKPMPHPRGYDSFVELSKFDYHASRRMRGKSKAIAEVTIGYAVRDITSLVKRVEERAFDGDVSALFER